jgi:Lipase (class 3)
MTITAKDLFLSILAMDSYNRGYGAGISDSVDNDQNGLGLGVASARIGGATLGQDISTQAAKEAGFYAVTYTLGSETIISYRGTNFNAGAAIADIVNGWAIAAGDFRASQFTLSTQFLSAVEADTNGPITLTGHSLGGALAGLNSRLYGYEAVLFDNEPYLQATDYLRQFFLREEGLLDGILAAQPLQAIEQVRAAILGNYSGGEVSIADARAAAHAIYDLELSQYTEE